MGGRTGLRARTPRAHIDYNKLVREVVSNSVKDLGIRSYQRDINHAPIPGGIQYSISVQPSKRKVDELDNILLMNIHILENGSKSSVAYRLSCNSRDLESCACYHFKELHKKRHIIPERIENL